MLYGYQWRCTRCGHGATFENVTGDKGVARFLWYKLIRSAWDQTLLVQDCLACGEHALRITYRYIQQDCPAAFAHHIVGLARDEAGCLLPEEALGRVKKIDPYVPMLWESQLVDAPGTSYFAFKYLERCNGGGLKRTVALTAAELGEVFALYHKRTGQALFT